MSSPHSSPLSTRRGSISAPDPFGTHVHLQRPSTSTLTIVRLPATTTGLQEPPNIQKKFSKRPGASAPTNQQHPGENRLSFAITSFGHPPSRSDGLSPSTSPSTSPRVRPSSPRQFSFGLVSKPRLSAEQLLDLARQAVNSRPTPGSSPHSPVLTHRPLSPHPQSPVPPIVHPTPATFTPLPDDIYLPFIHRAEEVSQLISGRPTAKLFALLSQAFRNKSEETDSNLSGDAIPPGDPVQWTYSQLIHHLTKVDRDVCSDASWAYAARKCILSHSESIWERVKAALGVPPELDIDEHEEGRIVYFDLDDSAIVDSPSVDRFMLGDPFVPEVYQRMHTALESPSGADTPVPAGHTDDPGARPHAAHGGVYSPAHDPISPVLSGHGDLEGSHLTIEPLLSTSAHSSHPPPLSLPSSLSHPASDGGLGDIAEGAEDEGEEDDLDEAKPKDDLDLVDPTQIQGLRISTGIRSPSDSVINSPAISVSIPNYSLMSSGQSDKSCSSRSEEAEQPSKGGVASPHITNQSLSRGRGRRSYHRTRPVSMSGYDLKDWDLPYDPVGERGPGNPLFPSNFARLALGPTLRANNPSLRSPAVPPQSRYAPGVMLHKGAFTTTGVWGHKARSQSWATPSRDAQSEYAITVASASESSVGE